MVPLGPPGRRLHHSRDPCSTGRAWRATDPKSKKTYADEVFMPDDSSPGDPTLARFGSEVKQLKAQISEAAKTA